MQQVAVNNIRKHTHYYHIILTDLANTDLTLSGNISCVIPLALNGIVGITACNVREDVIHIAQ